MRLANFPLYSWVYEYDKEPESLIVARWSDDQFLLFGGSFGLRIVPNVEAVHSGHLDHRDFVVKTFEWNVENSHLLKYWGVDER
jgi:hypothetical protein